MILMYYKRHSELDCAVPPVAFRYNLYNNSTPLRFGYFITDGFMEASEACVRAVRQTVMSLQRQGYEVVPFKPPNGNAYMELYFGLMTADGMKTLQQETKSDVIDSSLRTTIFLAKLTSLYVFLKS